MVICVAAILAFRSWRSPPAANPTPRPLPTASKPPVERAGGGGAGARDAGPARQDVDTPDRYRPLLGDWLRPDGGYVLSVAAVDDQGSARVRYLNPRPINVGSAEVREEGDRLGLFVELRDRHYPGSTYTLTFDEEGDQLVGVYYQALQRASYDVVFVRRR
jgi:hypothetical protein